MAWTITTFHDGEERTSTLEDPESGEDITTTHVLWRYEVHSPEPQYRHAADNHHPDCRDGACWVTAARGFASEAEAQADAEWSIGVYDREAPVAPPESRQIFVP